MTPAAPRGSRESAATVQSPRAVLAQCIRDCAAARDGRGRRWAARRAEQALMVQAGGHLTATDVACVQAARRLGEWLAAR